MHYSGIGYKRGIESVIKASFDNQRVFLNIKHIPRTTKRSVEKAFHAIAKDLKKTAKSLIRDKKKKTGRIYIKRLKGRIVRHQASAPNEAPANFTGNLMRSVGSEISGSDKLIFGAGGKNTNVHYAKFLERGTKKMRKRPFLRTAIEDNFRNIENHINTFIRKGHNKR